MSFKFKQFSVEDEGCTMKVGTDSVLLGSWVNTRDTNNILDIGTGCGIIALMLAQRSPKAQIDAVEVDRKSCTTARENVKQTPWSKRIKIVNSSFQKYHQRVEHTYDLIVSNPPYFENSLKPKSERKKLSKHNDSLGYDELLHGAKKLMSRHSRLAVILPYDQSKNFKEKALFDGLFCNIEVAIVTKTGSSPNRCLMEFMSKRVTTNWSELTIRNKDGSFSNAYKRLTGAFYLDF